ncbi:MAG: hypothetical protein LBF19_06165 [Prevotellaceae bacterium]|jgi:hypothetical protein|nr:hypothetical protein [Prevotellaceae bacterium]
MEVHNPIMGVHNPVMGVHNPVMEVHNSTMDGANHTKKHITRQKSKAVPPAVVDMIDKPLPKALLENPYMQYFCGMCCFEHVFPLDPVVS